MNDITKSKEVVLHVHPQAFIVHSWGRCVVRRGGRHVYRDFVLGEGDTEAHAWADAVNRMYRRDDPEESEGPPKVQRPEAGLRDHFAELAMQSLLTDVMCKASADQLPQIFARLADAAYIAADAMLEARDK